MEGYFLKRTLQTWQLEARNEAHPLQTMASRGLILSSPATCLTFQAKKANPTFYLAIQFTWEIHMPSKMSYLARTCQVTLDRKCYTTAVGARPARKSMHWNADSLLFHDIKLQASKLYLRCRLVVRTRAVALVPLWEGVRWESLVWASCWEHETWRVFIFQKHSIFSSQKAWLNKANRLKAPVFDHCDFSDYNGILESRRKKKKWMRGIWEERLLVFTSLELWFISFEVLLTLYHGVLLRINLSSSCLLWRYTSLFLSLFTHDPSPNSPTTSSPTHPCFMRQ